jgi:hypothetical protein
MVDACIGVGVLAAVAFLVAFVLTDALRLPRPAYLSALMGRGRRTDLRVSRLSGTGPSE